MKYNYYNNYQANNEDDDSEYSDDSAEETALESYCTPLDKDNNTVDEYVIFKTVLQGSVWRTLYKPSSFVSSCHLK